jgi:uncharacterized protein DUF4013
MSYPSSNPYASPAGLPPKPPMEPPALRYLESFQYIFAHPEWVMNVVLAAVCALIPVIGGIVVTGYAYEITESLHRFPGQLYPKFDFGRFSQYLMRGVWPFLVGIVVGAVVTLPMTCIMLIPMFIIMGMAGAAGDKDAAGAAAGLGMCCVYGSIPFLSAALQVVMTPFLLRAGLAQDFAEAFKFNWAMDFLRKMWIEIVLVILFLFAVGLFVLAPLTLVTCFIGAYPAMALALMAQAHLFCQLYNIYLARGGEPIPLKPWDGPAPLGPAPL